MTIKKNNDMVKGFVEFVLPVADPKGSVLTMRDIFWGDPVDLTIGGKTPKRIDSMMKIRIVSYN